ncbi:MAG: alpha-hydroxy acid oxidase [Hyphomicrobiales bacterium]
MAVIANIEDLRKRAKRRVPRMFFDYVDSGSYDENTLYANRRDLDDVSLQQRVLVGVEGRTTKTTILGEEIAMPVALAPTGLAGMVYPDGEIHGCREAQKFGVPYTLSTVSICSLEDVAARSDRPFWFQLYVMRDRQFVASLIERAKQAGCRTLVLTVDLPLQGQRHADIRNGLSVPVRLTFGNALNIATKPRWAFGMLRAKRWSFGNLNGYLGATETMKSMAEWVSRQFDPTITWDDVDWVRSQWDGKFVVKGILSREDARIAAQHDINAIVVSNHGGRQLDGAMSSVRALAEVIDQVGDRMEVWVDGGVRSGADVLKMITMGARCVLIGRAWLYGLGAMGAGGVRKTLEIIHKELDVAMALSGTVRLDHLSETSDSQP